MILKILITVAIVLVIFIVIVALQPADFRVERSTTISASPETVFAEVNDLHKWQAWSPWAKLDPEAKLTYEGPEQGVGAAYSWASKDNKVGEGRMSIIESKANELIRFKLEFKKPFEATNTAEFTFKAEGAQTKVNWSMFGTRSFMFKAVGLFMSCDKMIGPDFEKGLRDLKALVENAHP